MVQVREKIVKALLDSHETIEDLLKILGYKEKSYANLTPFLDKMKEENMIDMVKDKSVKRPGAKPTIVTLKEDIPNLKRLWKKYSNHKETIEAIRFSGYFLNVLPLLVQSMKEQATRNFTGYQAFQWTMGKKDKIALFMLLPFNPPLVDFILNEGLIKKRKKFEEYYMKFIPLRDMVKEFCTDYYTVFSPTALFGIKKIPFEINHVKKFYENSNSKPFFESSMKKIDYSAFFHEMEKICSIESELLDRYKNTLPEDRPEFSTKVRIMCEDI